MAAQGALMRWARENGRFPDTDNPEEVAQAATGWAYEVADSLVPQAFVDLGLFYSPRRTAGALDLSLGSFRQVVQQVADDLAVALTLNYRP